MARKPRKSRKLSMGRALAPLTSKQVSEIAVRLQIRECIKKGEFVYAAQLIEIAPELGISEADMQAFFTAIVSLVRDKALH